MLDIKFVKKNKEKVKKALAKKHTKFDIDGLIKAYNQYVKLKQEVEEFRAEQNKLSKGGKKPAAKEITKAKEIKEKLEKRENDLEKAEKDYQGRMAQIHNLPDKSVPAGPDESGNRVIKKWGRPREFNFEIKDHIALGQALDIIDKKRGVKVSGSRFTFLKNEAYTLQFAIIRYLEEKLSKKGFTPLIPPVLVKESAMFGSGFFPAERGEYYQTNDKDNLYLVGTAEVPLASYHADEILKGKDLPLRYFGYSSCFRREAGNYGLDTKGILRLHQFDKVEMFILAKPEESWDIYENELAVISEEILQELKLPYQKVLMCAGDIGMPNAKKYDFEVWLPAQKRYRELMSCSHDTDFQARRLKIRYKNKSGQLDYVHTMNNTALAIGRTLIAILENYQQKDGSVEVPKALQKYAGFDKIEE